MAETSDAPLKATVLNAAHRTAGGRMVAFGGYDMPVQYAGPQGGVLAEHRWTREHAGLFDVSHMGPAFLAPPATARPTTPPSAPWSSRWCAATSWG